MKKSAKEARKNQKRKVFFYRKRSRKVWRILVLMLFLCGCGQGAEGALLIGEEALNPSCQEEPESIRSGAEEALRESPTEMVSVYVCGAVRNPGVVELPADSRVEAALEAAGGFDGEAAPEAVNLAAKVTDGEMLYFPTRQEADVRQQEREAAQAGLININTADAAALCTLPGIGEARARDIISCRESEGPFESCEDIMKVPGIKDSVYEKIKDKITVH